jgi:hypothetical protein
MPAQRAFISDSLAPTSNRVRSRDRDSGATVGFPCRSAFAEFRLLRIEDGPGFGDRPITAGYRNDATGIDT